MTAPTARRSQSPLVRPRWTPRAASARAIEVWRAEGPRSLMFRVLGETVYRRMIVMERRFDFSMRDVEPALPVTFGSLEPAEIDEYLRLRPDADPGEILDRFRRRHVCYVARHEGRVVQACWVGIERARVEYLNCWFHLASGIGYLQDLYTAPEFRGRNLHRAQYPHMFQYFRNTGCIAVMAAFNPENRVQRIFARLGFRPVAMAGAVRVGPWRRVFQRSLDGDGEPPRFRVSLREDP